MKFAFFKISFQVFYLHIFVVQRVYCYLSQTNPSTKIPGSPSPPGTPWPMPNHMRSTNDLITIGPSFKYLPNVQGCEPLDWAIQKYNSEFLFGKDVAPDATAPVLDSLSIFIPDIEANECFKYPQFTNEPSYEAYKLKIRVDENYVASASIDASTVWGALRGIETFSQLWFTNDWESPERHFYANVTKIGDWPRFGHRGVLVDTARHYLKMSTIINILDAMSYNKFNVLHWHVVNDQSFPYRGLKFPELAEKGAFSSKAIYTPEMVKHIIEEARLRGIRVLLEFVTPGHTHALRYSHLELLTPCYGDGVNPGTANFPMHAEYENLDPTKESTYEFMAELFAEIADLSKDDFLHLGMDEVYKACWASSREVKKFMEDHEFTNLEQVEAHYIKRHIDMVTGLGKNVIIWQDPTDEGMEVPTDAAVVQIWKTMKMQANHVKVENYGWKNYSQELLDKGYQIILSAPWYLNIIKYGPTWVDYYGADPVLSLDNLKPGQEQQILGGEAAIWGELVDNTNVIQLLFPHSCAVAEKLWSQPLPVHPSEVGWRLDEQRCRMLWRGIQAQPVYPGYCGPWEVDGDR